VYEGISDIYVLKSEFGDEKYILPHNPPPKGENIKNK